VTLDIGVPDTALNDTLPPLSEPGLPEVQSTPGPDESIAAAVDPIGKIKPQLPG
jgi:hypothetical protein